VCSVAPVPEGVVNPDRVRTTRRSTDGISLGLPAPHQSNPGFAYFAEPILLDSQRTTRLHTANLRR